VPATLVNSRGSEPALAKFTVVAQTDRRRLDDTRRFVWRGGRRVSDFSGRAPGTRSSLSDSARTLSKSSKSFRVRRA
jgi:hypothetical protein